MCPLRQCRRSPCSPFATCRASECLCVETKITLILYGVIIASSRTDIRFEPDRHEDNSQNPAPRLAGPDRGWSQRGLRWAADALGAEDAEELVARAHQARGRGAVPRPTQRTAPLSERGSRSENAQAPRALRQSRAQVNRLPGRQLAQPQCWRHVHHQLPAAVQPLRMPASIAAVKWAVECRHAYCAAAIAHTTECSPPNNMASAHSD